MGTSFLSMQMNFSYWLNTTAYTPLQLTLAVVGNLSWVLAYLWLIRNARKQGFMEMPLFIGAGNIAWEALYSFVFAEYINLGMAIVWGVRAWFFLDCYIFYLSLKTAPRDISTPLIQRYIMPIGIALVLIWFVLIWAIVAAGLDNVPFGSAGAVKLGGVSAYILNTGISLLFLAQYLRLYSVQFFSKSIAWAKMIGTGVTTVFFALIDPQNIFLLSMGAIVFAADMAYIVLLYVLPCAPMQSLSSMHSVKNAVDVSSQNVPLLTFPPNRAFDELWARNPEYFELNGYRLRKLQLPHWRYADDDFSHEGFVLEGLILASIDKGDCGAQAASALGFLTDTILREMDMYGKPLWFFTDAREVGKTDSEARAIINKSYETVFRGARLFLVTNEALRLVVRLLRVFVSDKWQLFRTPEEAFAGLLTSLPNAQRTGTRSETAEPMFPPNPIFDELWAKQPDYLEFKGFRLRKLQLPHWHYTDATYHRETFVLEGTIICNTDIGDCTGEAAENCTRLVDSVLKELDLYGKPLYFIDNGLRIGKVSAEARRNANISFTTLFRGLHLFLVTTDLTRIGFRLIRPFSPEAYRNWQLFGSFEDALGGMLRTHFMLSGGLEISSSASSSLSSDFPPSYHEHRIDELYTILAKIAYNEFDSIPTPVLPENDMYADIFKALSIVMEDKRLQMEQVLAQKGQLEEQAAQIQLVNTELSQQNVSLAALNREKSEIMGIVAHDLKNPIGAIRGLAELIESGFSDIDAAKTSEIAAQIVRTSNRMLDLVKNILDINQLEEGAMGFNPVQINLAPIVESAVWQYLQAAQAKKITIHCDVDSTSAMLAVVDEQAIIQVFDNLISNAVKYSPHGKNVFVRLQTSGSNVRFEVQDEGEGISPSDMTKLFGKFVRLSAQPTGGEHSTGLGLSIVKKMVDAMNGNVWCESEFGQGATFIVELPAVSQTISTIIEA